MRSAPESSQLVIGPRVDLGGRAGHSVDPVALERSVGGGREQPRVDLVVPRQEHAAGETAQQGALLAAQCRARQLAHLGAGGALDGREVVEGGEVRGIAADDKRGGVAVTGSRKPRGELPVQIAGLAHDVPQRSLAILDLGGGREHSRSGEGRTLSDPFRAQHNAMPATAQLKSGQQADDACPDDDDTLHERLLLTAA